MAKKKLKKFLKKAAKAALIGGALYAGSKLLKGKRGTRSVNPVGGLDALVAAKLKRNRAIDVGIQSAEDDKGSGMYVPKKFKMPDDPMKYQFQKKGGRIGAKHGGRTRKQFGGGLNRPVGGVGSTARRDMRSGYYPSDMGMRGGPMYKKGGRVKSMGIAKRGGGAAKR